MVQTKFINKLFQTASHHLPKQCYSPKRACYENTTKTLVLDYMSSQPNYSNFTQRIKWTELYNMADEMKHF